MSYEDFEADGVYYRLILSNHYSSRREPIKDLDALVVETGCHDLDDFKNKIFGRSELEKYYKIIATKGMPIYSVDNKGRNPSSISFLFYSRDDLIKTISKSTYTFSLLI